MNFSLFLDACPAFSGNGLAVKSVGIARASGIIGLTENMHGINVLDEETLKKREAIFGEIYAHDFSSIDSSIFYRLAITNPYKLIVPDKNNKPEEDIMLFNIIEDPYEKDNLAEKKPEIIKELSLLIDNFWSE
jgi:hypothetical protein